MEQTLTLVPGGQSLLANSSGSRPLVTYGVPYVTSCLHHAIGCLNAQRIYMVVSASIYKTSTYTLLRDALGIRVAAVRLGLSSHAPWDEVLDVAKDLETSKPDVIITLGAGSISDGVKVARLAHANEAYTPDSLQQVWESVKSPANAKSTVVRPCAIPIISIPTSLSGGEYTAVAGATRTQTHKKLLFWHNSLIPDVVVLDPAVTLSTPRKVWISSGVRAIDHCVEGLCSYGEAAGDAETKTDLEKGLNLLLPNLLTTNDDWENAEARLKCMLAVVSSSKGMKTGLGASHGIGRQLGPLGVGHGETSCIMLPAVMRYNWTHGNSEIRDLQLSVLKVFWRNHRVAQLLEKNGHDKADADLGGVIETFVAALGMPTRLQAVGIGRSCFSSLAENALLDWCTRMNPVSLNKTGVIEILETVAGN